jgi:hypothetical protein
LLYEKRREAFGPLFFGAAGLEPIKCNSPVGSEGSAACGRINDPSEWQRSTDAKVLCHRRQMSGTATGHLLAAGLDGGNTIISSSPVATMYLCPVVCTGDMPLCLVYTESLENSNNL